MSDLNSSGATRSVPVFQARQRFYRETGKRGLDIFIVICSLPILLPVISVLALLVMLDGGKPFFGHLRVGRDGQVFRCWKLRSMVPDAEARLRTHLSRNHAARAEWEADFKLTKDPRITRIGHFIRRSSLDELPQIWNILKGEMSTVGPRPVTKEETALYGSGLRHYHMLRPGLTGLWQVSGRNNISYADRVVLDVAYARHHDLMMDIRIIFATFLAVLHRTGK